MLFLILLLLLPISISFGPAGCPLFMVSRVGHIYAILHPFVVFPAVKLLPLVLGSGIKSRSVLSDIF